MASNGMGRLPICSPIASNSDEHVAVLAALATTLADPNKAERLRMATDTDQVIDLLTHDNKE